MDDRSARAIGALADELRHRLYRYVVEQTSPVGRDQAAVALGIPRHTAKFHLDRLEDVGLLASEYERRSGRTGPGAGRPAKVYRRAPGDVAVSLPGREYDLAADLMAQAIDSTGSRAPVRAALDRAASAKGRSMGDEASAPGTPTQRVQEVLTRHGYEPRNEAGRLVLANCPFHALRAEHTALVCAMNHSLIGGMCEQIGPLRAELEPAQERCCVVITSG